MPLTDALGNLALEHARLAADPRVPWEGFRFGNLETWLSRLAEDQPDLDIPQNLENRALFFRMTEAMMSVLTARQGVAQASSLPQWLDRFVRLVSHTHADVITLNYDTLVEDAVDRAGLENLGSRISVNSSSLLADVPIEQNGQMLYQPWMEPGLCSRLLKLHGSLDWYWSPGQPSVRRIQIPRPQDDPRLHTLAERSAAGLVRFVVPPTSLKSGYYSNSVTSRVWQRAAESLRSADRVHLMGYSAPRTDFVVSGMLFDSLRTTRSTVVVANPRPASVRDALVQVGLDRGRIESISGVGAISTLVNRYRDELASNVVEQLEDLRSQGKADWPVVVGWAYSRLLVVKKVRIGADGIVVSGRPLRIQGPGADVESMKPMRVSDVLAVASASRRQRTRSRLTVLRKGWRCHILGCDLDISGMAGAPVVLLLPDRTIPEDRLSAG
jgi:hypothetical protein